MDRYHNGEHGRRRDELGRDTGPRSFRDHDEQDFTQRSFASTRDAERGRRYADDRFPEDAAWRDSAEDDERFGMSRYEPEYGRHGGWPRDDRFGAPYGTGQWQRERRSDPDAWEGRSYEGRSYEGRSSERRVWDEGRGWDARVQDERERRRDVRGGEGRRDEQGRYGRGADRDLYASGAIYDTGGHRSRQGWRDQHGWGRDVARDLDVDSDPYGGRFAGRGPKSYQRGDERVREDVCDRLTADGRVDASDITVHVQNGEVTLEGTVDDRAMKRRAEDTTDAVDGVRQVHNRLTVQNENRSNEEMQPFQWGGERGWRGWDPEAGRGGFATRERGNDQGRERGYGAAVAGGYAGYDQPDRHRDSMRQGRPASMRDEQRGAWLGEEPGRFGRRGPKGYQRSDDRIREDVCDRLTADDGVDATNVSVSVQGGEVTLEGSIDDRSMKRRAEDCADAVAGVRQVHNRLVVQPRHEAQGQSTSPLGTKEPATSIGTSAASGSATSGTPAGSSASASRAGKG